LKSEATGRQSSTNVRLSTNKEPEQSQADKENIALKMQEIKERGRLMADSSLTTYFGKPAFHSYGNGNLLPA